jgi:hypothetical protein
MPLPGSDIWEELDQAGMLGKLEWDRMFVHDVAYCDEGITAGQLKSLQRSAYLKFYLRPRILISVLREIRSVHHLQCLLTRFIDALT